MELLQRLLGCVSLQRDSDSDVGIASVPFTQAEKDGQINMSFQFYTQLFNLDAANRSVGCVANRQATAESSEHLLHGIRRRVCSPQHLRFIGIHRWQITDADLVTEAALPDNLSPPDCISLCRLLLNLAAQRRDPANVHTIDTGYCAHSFAPNN